VELSTPNTNTSLGSPHRAHAHPSGWYTHDLKIIIKGNIHRDKNKRRQNVSKISIQHARNAMQNDADN